MTDTVEKYKEEIDQKLEKLSKHADDLDERSMSNFAAWREYLHKYYVLILAFIGGSGFFTALQNIERHHVKLGIFLALAGVFVGFIAINIYFYLERKWLQISSAIRSYGLSDTHKHAEVEDDPVLAGRLNIKEKIKNFQIDLVKAKRDNDRKKIRHLKKMIRGHKNEIYLMRFLGQQFGKIEKFWILSVGISFALTSVGVTIILVSILYK